MKKYFKNKKYVLLICLFFVGMAVASAAVTIFPSSEVTYDNTTSGLTATNVQAAIDELDASANSCPVIDPAILEAVPMLPTYQNLGEPDIVTSGDGLYVDNSEGITRLIYKGASPDNYIYIKENGVNQLYRIYSIEADGTMKVIRDTAVTDMIFDADDATRRMTGYCATTYCNAWAAMTGFVNGNFTGDVAGLNGNTGDSSIKEYIDNTYSATLDDYSKIVSKTWNISGTTYNRETLENAIADEKKSTWNGKIALLTSSEYVRANSNTSSCGTPQLLRNNYRSCYSTNYLRKPSDWWLLSPESSNESRGLSVLSISHVDSDYACVSNGVRPAFYLKSGLNLKGKGTQVEPYEIVTTYSSLGSPPIVTSGNGLYKDDSEGFTRFIYKGTNTGTNNYIYIKENGTNVKYRIYSIELDDTIKVIRDTNVVSSMSFDADDATRRKTGYCSSYNYCNAWAAMDNFVNGSYSGAVAGLNGNSGDSSIKEYIDNTYSATLDDYSKIVSKTWNISGTAYNRDTLENAIADEKKSTWNGKIALLTSSEYVRANTNISECGTHAKLYSNYSTCRSTNYLANSTSWWLLSPRSSYRERLLTVISLSYVNHTGANGTNGVRPSFYLCAGLTYGGSGTSGDPYYISGGSCS